MPLRILNRDTGTVIPGVEHKSTIFQKAMGLRFRKAGRAFFSFHEPTRAAIDMALVRGPLDIAFIDKDMEIIEVHGAFPLTYHPATWRLYRPEQPYRYVLEVEKNLLQDRGFAEGHRVSIVGDEER